MKFTKHHEKALCEFMDKMDSNGICTVDQWATGRGRFTKPRALPPFVQRFERKVYAIDSYPHHGTPERKAFEFFRANPRRRSCLVLNKSALAEFVFENIHCKEF